MKVIIAGGRDFRGTDDDWKLLEDLDMKHTFDEIVSGRQATWDKQRKEYYGADYFGEQYAKAFHVEVKPFPADWLRLGKAAGPIRNKQMAEYADAVILFPGGRGTANMRKLAKEHGLSILYDADQQGM